MYTHRCSTIYNNFVVLTEDEDDDTELLQLRTKLRTKKRMMLTKTKNRKSPNFDDLFNNESEDQSRSQISINEQVELNKNKTPDQTSKELIQEKGTLEF